MKDCYEAPPSPFAQPEVELATTMTLVVARDAISDKHESTLGQATGKVKKTWFSWKASNSLVTAITTKVAATSAAATLVAATGGAALPVVLAVAAGAKIATKALDRTIGSSERKKRIRKYSGPEGESPTVEVAELITSAARHFTLAQKALLKVRVILRTPSDETFQYDTLVKQYAKFYHHRYKAAFYLEALLVLTFNYYEMLGIDSKGRWTARGLAPEGRQQRDLLIFLTRAACARRHVKGAETKLPDKEKDLLSQYDLMQDLQVACCPEDPFGPVDQLSDASEILPVIVQLHEESQEFKMPDPGKEAEIKEAGVSEVTANKIAKEFMATFQQIRNPSNTQQLKHSFQRTWGEKGGKDKGKDLIDKFAATADVFVPVPGAATKGMSLAVGALWGKIADEAELFKADEVLSLWDAQKKQIKSAHVIKEDHLAEMASKVNKYIIGGARHMEIAKQALDAVAVQTAGAGYELDLQDKRSRKLVYLLLAYKADKEQPINVPAAIKDPSVAAKQYYEYVYHTAKAINYTRLSALFECSLATGISALNQLDVNYFPHVMRRIAQEATLENATEEEAKADE